MRNLSYVGKVAKMAKDVHRLGATSLDLCLVALGLADRDIQPSVAVTLR